MSIKKFIPNTITSGNLLCGALGVIFTLRGRMDIAFWLMISAAVFDFCDGLAARLLGAYSDIGKELDSLCDVVSFGLLPSIMLCQTMYQAGATDWTCFIPLFIAPMSALRLAKFNLDERQHDSFIGLPTPACAIICGSLALWLSSTDNSCLAGSVWFIPAVSILLGLLLVSEIPMFAMKFGGRSDEPEASSTQAKARRSASIKRTVFLVLALLTALAISLLRLHWSLIPLGIFLIYILINLLTWKK